MKIDKKAVLDLINDLNRLGGFKDYNSYQYLFSQVDAMSEPKEDVKSDEYIRGYKAGIKAPRVGDEIMRFNGDKGVITNVDYDKEDANILWYNGRTSFEGLYTYSTTGITYDIQRILRELKKEKGSDIF